MNPSFKSKLTPFQTPYTYFEKKKALISGNAPRKRRGEIINLYPHFETFSKRVSHSPTRRLGVSLKITFDLVTMFHSVLLMVCWLGYPTQWVHIFKVRISGCSGSAFPKRSRARTFMTSTTASPHRNNIIPCVNFREVHSRQEASMHNAHTPGQQITDNTLWTVGLLLKRNKNVAQRVVLGYALVGWPLTARSGRAALGQR